MSRTASSRFSGVRGAAFHVRQVWPIRSLRTAAAGNAAAVRPAASVRVKSRRFMQSSSECEAQAEAEDALVHAFPADAAGAGDGRKPAEVAHRPVRIELEVGHIGGWVREVGRVGQVEDLGAKLRAELLGEVERAIDAEV